MTEDVWSTLDGGYRCPYDPRPAIGRLRDGDASAWDELWNELHHQGDVGPASYAAVPLLVTCHRERDVAEWQTYALIGCIESCRDESRNPPVPAWLQDAYHAAWRQVLPMACRDLQRSTDESLVRSALGAVALAAGLRPLGDLMLRYSGEELMDLIGPR